MMKSGGRPVRILLVDDEQSLLTTLAANLELEGFDVVEAGSAAAALVAIGRGRFDLVLSDVRMPGATGVELFRKVREERPELPFLLMTAFSVEVLIEEALAHGVYAVLPKPFEIDRAVFTLLRAARAPYVLVIDDLRGVAESLAAMLDACGVRARAEPSGERAVELVRSGEVDVCLVDLVMPGLDGPAVIEKIRRIDPSIACIAISGHDVPEMMRRLSASGATSCLRKPVPPQVLVREIARARWEAQ
jgi:DNA-binding NtrC family response regulator